MSITKRILDVARSNLNALLEKAAEQADPRRKLADVPDAELEAELARRKAAKQDQARVEGAKAQVDASSSTQQSPPPKSTADRAERERQAKEREARVRAAREERERQARAQQQQRQQQSRAGAGPKPFGKKEDPALRGYYAVLELPYGASWDEVKASYRRLMRKYHPDLHTGSPEKLRAATEVSQALTVAYNELEKHLLGGPNRSK